MTAEFPRLAVGAIFYQTDEKALRSFAETFARARDAAAHECAIDFYFVSHDGSARYAEYFYKFPALNAHVVESPGNPGFGTGMNRLMTRAFSAGAQYFLGANPDGIFHPDLFRAFLADARKNPRAVLEARQFPSEHPKRYDPSSGKTEWITGCCFWVPQEIFLATRGFDENIFMYCEDVDFSWRVKLSGFETLLSPQALFWHSPFNRGQRAVTQSHLSARYLAKKWHDPEFLLWCEARLVENCGFNPNELPAIPPPPNIAIDQARRVANFRHELRFAESRW